MQGFSVPSFDPGEEFPHVHTQFYGLHPKPNASISMTGLLADYVGILEDRVSAGDIGRLAPMCLETFTSGQLPVLSQLARHYAVCDGWHRRPQRIRARRVRSGGAMHVWQRNGQVTLRTPVESGKTVGGWRAGADANGGIMNRVLGRHERVMFAMPNDQAVSLRASNLIFTAGARS